MDFDDIEALAAYELRVLEEDRRPRVRVRTHGAGHLPRLMREVRRVIALAQPDDVEAIVRLRGGYVPVKAMGGDADWLTLRVGLLTGSVDIDADRGRADKRADGKGDMLVSRLRRAEQSTGRVV